MKTCIISWPVKNSKSAHVFLYDFVRIIQSCSDEVYLITEASSGFHFNDNGNTKLLNIHPFSNSEKTIMQMLDESIYQIKVCSELIKARNQIDIIWVYGGAYLVLPIALARILNKKVYLNVLGPEAKRIRETYTGLFGAILSSCFYMVEQISLWLTNTIVVESESMITFAELERFRYKTITIGARFIDTINFYIKDIYNDRKNLVGYVGRISREKGIKNFVDAIILLGNKNTKEKLQFYICGDGPIINEVKQDLNKKIMCNSVEFTGWISHNDLPVVLNKLKILVLPSYTEGLPTIIMEAMACGTPVLATPVGGIPDLIRDGETGFIINDNSPESIADGINRVLTYQDIDKIITNANKLIEQEYSFSSSINRYSKIFSETS